MTVLLSVLALAFVAFVSAYCCTPNQWSGIVTNWDPSKNFFSFGEIAYDYSGKREYFTAVENYGRRRVNVTYVLLYQAQKGYRIMSDPHGGSATCSSFPLNGSMPQYCVGAPAMNRVNVTIGETLNTQVWEYRSDQGESRLEITDDCVPVRAVGIFGRNHNIDEEDYYDVVPRVDSGLFNAPTDC